MDTNEMLKSIKDNTAELRNAQDSLAKKYDVLETEKIARLDNDFLAVQKELAEVRAVINRSGESKEAAVKAAEARELFVKGVRKGWDALTSAEQKALSIEGTSNGSATVPAILHNAIIEDRNKVSAIRSLATILTTSSDNISVPVQSGFAAGGFKGETSTRSITSSPTVEDVEIKVHENSALPEATLAIIEDSAFNIEAWLQAEVSKALGFYESLTFVKGTGVNEPKGILAFADSTAAFNKVKEFETAANTGVTALDVMKMYHDLPVAFRANAALVGSDGFMLAARSMTNSNGDYLWQDQIALDVPPTLYGKPVYVDEHLDEVAAGKSVAIFGDFKSGYGVLDRAGMTLVRDVYTKPGYVKFYVRTRVGGSVLQGKALRILKVAD